MIEHTDWQEQRRQQQKRDGEDRKQGRANGHGPAAAPEEHPRPVPAAIPVEEVMTSGPGAAPGDALYDLSQDGLALDMGRTWKARPARHVALWGRWLFWNGARWEPDEALRHMTRTRAYLRRRADDLVRAANEGSIPDLTINAAEKLAKELRKATTVAAVVGLARSNAELASTADLWDRDPLLLTAGNATVSLPTGQTRQPDPLDYITKAAAVAPAPPGTPAPLWELFLNKITGENEELKNYLQRVAGYCLTGSIREHALFFFYGTGANGKSVFIKTLQGVLRDYAVTVGSEMLMISHTERHPTEVASLRGARLATATEIEDGRTWAESKIKALTGGDRLQARFMRQDFFEFDPQFKLIVTGNNKPSLRNVDEAVRRRLHLVPFTVTIPPAVRDEDLFEKLRTEWPAILRWAIDGTVAWQRDGLDPPSAVRDATQDYLAAEDALERWLEDCTTANMNAWESSADLWGSWKRWAEAGGEFVGKRRKFIERLEDHGFPQDRTRSQRGYRGIAINRPDYTEDPRYGN